MYAICRRNAQELNECGDRFGIKIRYTDYAKLLADPNVDAVHINSPIPDHAAAEPGRPQGRQARRLHRADGDQRRGMQANRRGPAQQRQGLHDDGDRRLQPRIPVREGAVRQGRAGPDSVPARQPSAGHGRLARLLARPAADALRHALRQPVPGIAGQARRERRLPRLRPHPRGADRPTTAARSPSRRRRSRSATPTSSPR